MYFSFCLISMYISYHLCNKIPTNQKCSIITDYTYILYGVLSDFSLPLISLACSFTSIMLIWLMLLCSSCLVAKSRPSLCNRIVLEPTGLSYVHGVSQARILECVVISFSGDHPKPGLSPALAGGNTEPPERPVLLCSKF